MSPKLKHIEVVSKSTSLVYWRKVYRLINAHQYFYLKTQTYAGHEVFIKGFENEVFFYKKHYKDHVTLPVYEISPRILDELNIQNDTLCLMLPEAHKTLLDIQPFGLNLPAIMGFILKLSVCLGKIHQLGYIHGDIKKDHFLTYNGQIFLLDFEHTHFAFDNNSVSLNATPRYMAPELFHGACKSVQTDLYALGIVLYEWLTQHRLATQSYQAWAQLHCQEYFFELPQQYNKLQLIIDGLLAKSSALRFKTTAELIQVIQLI